MTRRPPQLHTTSVRGPLDRTHRDRPVVAPIYQSAMFEAADLDAQVRAKSGDRFYTRYANPTCSAAEARIAELEGAQAASVFASGMAAISTALMVALRAGDHLVAQSDVYGAALEFIRGWLPRYGVEATLVDGADPGEFERAMRTTTRAIYVESPSNPMIKVVDLKRIAELGRANAALTMIDNTFATPINQRPHEFGIDVVVHSGTKFLAGHSDLVCGAVTGGKQFISELGSARRNFGGVMDPHAAWLLTRGLKTLALRVERQNENALQLARYLERQSCVRRVHYPLLEGHPQEQLARAQMAGGGGVVSVELDLAPEEARRFVEGLTIFALAGSLGGVESLVTIPALTTHAMIPAEERHRLGITDTLVRFAVGIEAFGDLVADIDQALGKSIARARTAVPRRAKIGARLVS